jgi:hypothetical protein
VGATGVGDGIGEGVGVAGVGLGVEANLNYYIKFTHYHRVAMLKTLLGKYVL